MRGRARGAGWRGWAAAGVFFIVGLAAPAGGLGLAPAAALGGLLFLPFSVEARRAAAAAAGHPAAQLFAAFILWAGLSLVWSPADEAERMAKFLAGAALYSLFLIGCARLSGPDRRTALAALVFGTLAGAVVFAMEMATSGGLTAAAREGEGADLLLLWRNLGHGLSALIVLAPAAVAVLWGRGGLATGAAVAVGLVALAGAIVFGLTANLLGVLAGALGLGLGALFARGAVRWSGIAAAATIAVAPLVSLAAALAPSGLAAGAPLSWKLRLEIWRFVGPEIATRPLFGSGFDASRTVHDPVTIDGQVFDVMPLHPHNAGLQVWFETGLIGAALASAAIVLGARRVASASGLSRRQAAAACGCALAYAASATVSYGAWQEWWVAAPFLAAAGCLLLSDPPKARAS